MKSRRLALPVALGWMLVTVAGLGWWLYMLAG